jgi:serine protease
MQSATDRQRTPAEIEAMLKASAAMFPGLPSHPIGAGIVDAQAAVEAVRKADAERLQATYTVIFSDDGEL